MYSFKFFLNISFLSREYFISYQIINLLIISLVPSFVNKLFIIIFFKLNLTHSCHYLRHFYLISDSDGKASAYNAGDPGSIPGLERSSGEGNGNPLQYSCLKKSHGRRILVGYSPWGSKELDTTEWLHFLSLKASNVLQFHNSPYATGHKTCLLLDQKYMVWE